MGLFWDYKHVIVQERSRTCSKRLLPSLLENEPFHKFNRWFSKLRTSIRGFLSQPRLVTRGNYIARVVPPSPIVVNKHITLDMFLVSFLVTIITMVFLKQLITTYEKNELLFLNIKQPVISYNICPRSANAIVHYNNYPKTQFML